MTDQERAERVEEIRRRLVEIAREAEEMGRELEELCGEGYVSQGPPDVYN